MKTSGNTILITGGASGIGRELAERFHAQGNTVIIAGRRQDRLDEVAADHEGIVGYALDISSPESIAAFAADVIRNHPELNVLINNAGVMMFEDLTQSRDLTDAESTIVTNLLGPIRLTNALIDHLTTRPDAAIVNVSSGLAFVPLVSTPTYSATKAAIHSYTVSLRDALKGKIEVIELAPPAVQTELTPGQSTRSGYMPLNDFMDEVMSLFSRQPTPPEILVKNVGFLRFAESEKRFDETLTTLNDFARKAREGGH
ncbi:putative oxidoreductase [Rhizobium sp. PP-F2F-G38]|uniref:SDR family NAD(P)-dependent oxidoreductase n=1 Tax=Ferranicluibacter rubi TaxID=2715133 RepID=A0AA43ZET3_9HYPH|nr:SDR family oxidoreductase [Ferranicluibacter rubi]NHT75638.1 SDR family NAD(P)-dependent oxidoreductase [Ferranicluibacter rubi]PYE32683.1 putative oxidoreductase [Rhizobium sp. PP-WC-1G-195]PYE96112.1 putative oxidoreductase [Rhizobium sp. PP-F2F-G38]TCQ23052.1 putative oxidoreductase [Rhizobium sp. PP-CC-3G-465]